MVNVDVSPSVVLGVGLIGAGVSLWQIRRVKPWISKDYDVVVSCVSLLVGGILIFQGWRLDPLLLFGQLMTTGAAVSFAIEALKLRSEQYETEEKAALQDALQRRTPGEGGAADASSSFQLPPPEQQPAAPWQAGTQPWQQPQQQTAGFYDYQQPGASNSYDPQQQQQQQAYGSTADGQWYYGTGYQVADVEEPPSSAPGPSGTNGGSSGGYFAGSGNPSEFVFPAAFEDGSSGTAGYDSTGRWGGYGEPPSPQQPGEGGGPQQQQPWGPQQQQQQPGVARPSSGWDMDDW